jgi:two-component system sensor kinase FixL
MKERSEEPLRALLDETAIGIKWIAPDGRLVEVNRSLCHLLGYNREELLQLRYDELTHPEDLDRDRALFAQLMAGKIRSYAIEKRYIAKNGETIYVRVTSALARAPEALRLAIVEDVRARRDAETIRQEEEIRVRSILEASRDGMVIVDEAGTIHSFGPAAERVFGYAAQEVLGKKIDMLMPSNPERDAPFMDRYLRASDRQNIGVTRMVIGLRKNGGTFPMELSVGEAVIGGRRIFTGFVRDNTERQEAERRLDHLQRELMHVARLSEMGQMGSTLAHELNQPLTAIANYLKAARRLLQTRSVPGVERILETMDKAGVQAQRAGEIIRHLRQFIEKRETERRHQDINSVVEEASALALVGAKSSGVVVHAELSPDAAVALVDKIQIQQVVVNLIRNAIEAMALSPKKILTVATRCDGECVCISITDTGPGLDPSVTDKLFQAFVTTKQKGMGIGLSISRQIVEAHGGRIAVDTPEGGGTRFVFTLPLALEYC